MLAVAACILIAFVLLVLHAFGENIGIDGDLGVLGFGFFVLSFFPWGIFENYHVGRRS
jgi:hypothetical protein